MNKIKHTKLIDDVINELLSNVPNDVYRLYSNSKTVYIPINQSIINLIDTDANMHKIGNEDYVKSALHKRYSLLIEGYFELFTKILHNEYVPYEYQKNTLETYLRKCDDILVMSIDKISQSSFDEYVDAITMPVTSTIDKETTISTDDLSTDTMITSVMGEKKYFANCAPPPVTTLHSMACNQHFSTFKTSDKGLIKLIRTNGDDFVFHASYISEVLPCYEFEKPLAHPFRSGVQILLDTISDTLSRFNSDGASKTVYTAIRLSGKYEGLIYIAEEYESSLQKIKEAISVSQSIYDKKHGSFS
ncbi:hypothetical protein [Scandinavium lactucae]|uniref:Uncharacterized protein n=1 Tax=Scandinavium lactucae TaxID=3095028 RepID=A0ABU4QU27_9ENTR|nr:MULTISPECIES: hypothetical protein [unclassified Scandinavium]MDX6042781.1 hypothetical protein [Scandinavium sp. V105_6]MDX6052782.1 hypothetical protein [Scandinavium sp. V105_1]